LIAMMQFFSCVCSFSYKKYQSRNQLQIIKLFKTGKQYKNFVKTDLALTNFQ
jgi:hypothetical protein